VHVRVTERRQGEPAAQVDHAGARAGQVLDVRVGAERLDHPAADGQGLHETRRVCGRLDLPADEGQVCLGIVQRSHRLDMLHITNKSFVS
jgi:hypothetical protein